MKAANISSAKFDANGVGRVTATITPDDGDAYTVENLGPAPITDEAALWRYLDDYDRAYLAGKAQEDAEKLAKTMEHVEIVSAGALAPLKDG